MAILSADDWDCIFVLFVVWISHSAQGATRGWVMPGPVSKRFPLCKLPLFDTHYG